LEHRTSNPVSVKNLTAIETSTIIKLLRPYVPVGTKRTRRRRSEHGSGTSGSIKGGKFLAQLADSPLLDDSAPCS
jgi:hypothetical protein